MFDIKKPIESSIIVLLISFLLSILILYCTKPSWVVVVGKSENKILVSWYLILSYSITFALVCAIGTLLFLTKERGPIIENSRKVSSMFSSYVRK